MSPFYDRGNRNHRVREAAELGLESRGSFHSTHSAYRYTYLPRENIVIIKPIWANLHIQDPAIKGMTEAGSGSTETVPCLLWL